MINNLSMIAGAFSRYLCLGLIIHLQLMLATGMKSERVSNPPLIPCLASKPTLSEIWNVE